MSVIYVLRQSANRLIWGMITALVFVGFSVSPVSAQEPYETTIVSMTGSGSLTMTPGERKQVTIEFQNTGSQTWQNDGPGYISVYTHGPKYRRSAFDPGTWIWWDQLSRIDQASVAPGQKASMTFEMHAPQEVGTYAETFHLASEDTAWVDGGQFTLNITVAEGASEPVEVKEVPETAEGYSGEVKVRTATRVNALAGRSILFTVGVVNTGTQTWNSFGLVHSDVAIASATGDFAHPSWSGTTLAQLDQKVGPGEMAIVNFAFNAPQVNGEHTATFQFEADGYPVDGALLHIPVMVTEGSDKPHVAPPVRETVEEDTRTYIEQPDIRVGVLIVDEETDNEVVITSLEDDFEIRDTEGALLGSMKKGDLVTAYYANGKYYFDRGNGAEVSSYGLRFVPAQEDGVLRVVNWDKRITRGSSHADNEFRGVLEVRYNDYKERTWLINELGIELYLRGMAETNDHDHEHYNKAQILAARSFAYFHIVHPKRAKEFMHLNSTPSDQYYLGYGREKRAPNFTQYVKETAGETVTYEGVVAVTPYYARSNGSTKDWSQVWWGDRPHVRGVAVPCDQGKTQWGHGVGMPQSGAECMAEDGSTYQEIITYFYTDVEIEPLWK